MKKTKKTLLSAWQELQRWYRMYRPADYTEVAIQMGWPVESDTSKRSRLYRTMNAVVSEWGDPEREDVFPDVATDSVWQTIVPDVKEADVIYLLSVLAKYFEQCKSGLMMGDTGEEFRVPVDNTRHLEFFAMRPDLVERMVFLYEKRGASNQYREVLEVYTRRLLGCYLGATMLTRPASWNVIDRGFEFVLPILAPVARHLSLDFWDQMAYLRTAALVFHKNHVDTTRLPCVMDIHERQDEFVLKHLTSLFEESLSRDLTQSPANLSWWYPEHDTKVIKHPHEYLAPNNDYMRYVIADPQSEEAERVVEVGGRMQLLISRPSPFGRKSLVGFLRDCVDLHPGATAFCLMSDGPALQKHFFEKDAMDRWRELFGLMDKYPETCRASASWPLFVKTVKGIMTIRWRHAKATGMYAWLVDLIWYLPEEMLPKEVVAIRREYVS